MATATQIQNLQQRAREAEARQLAADKEHIASFTQPQSAAAPATEALPSNDAALAASIMS